MSKATEETKAGEEIDEMEESLVPDLDALKKKKSSNSEISILVCNPIVKEDRFSKHTVYTIRGKDKEGNFEVIRRYSDFDKIRSLLVTRWPGCYIPPLPPKTKVGNMDSKFIEERRRMLNTFCQRVADLPYLHYSEEYQIFIRSGNADLEKTFAPMTKFTNDDLITKFSTNFTHLSGKELNNEIGLKIVSFKVFLQKTLNHFENFKKIARTVCQARRAFYDQFSQFHNQVCVDYEKNVFSEYHGNKPGHGVFSDNGDPHSAKLVDHVEKIKEASTQPSLEYLYEWLKLECGEIEAFIEACNQRDKYEQMKIKIQDKQKSDTAELNKVVAGKTTLKTFFSRKPKEEEMGKLEKQIEQGGKDIESISMVHDMITLILAYNEIEKFKQTKLDQYYYVVKIAAQAESGNTSNLITYWSDVSANENIKVRAPAQDL